MTAELTRHPPPRPPRAASAPDAVASAAVAPELPVQEGPAPDRSTVHRLLDTIDDLVRRHRALAARDGVGDDLHAELIAAELDQQVAVLRRLPRQSCS